MLLFFRFLFSTEECEKWFEKSGVKPGTESCELNCSILPTGMSTFICLKECKNLCKTIIPREKLDQYTYFDTLTVAEKNLVSKFPKEALLVYDAKCEANNSTRRIFKISGHNDESDAFRHCIWSALLTKELGEETANKFLDAHEASGLQPEDEKIMDGYNNKMGVNVSLKFKQKVDSIDFLEKECLQLVKNKKLKVLEPNVGIVPNWRE